MNQCNICKHNTVLNKTSSVLDMSIVKCGVCGEYEISGSLDAILKNKELPFTASFWIKEQNTYLITPKLHSDDLESLQSIPDKKINQKYELFLRELYEHPTDIINKDRYDNHSKFWCKDKYELQALISKAIENNHLKISTFKGIIVEWAITFDGREYVENLGRNNSSNKIFMAFHFTEDMKEQFEESIKKAVIDASNNKLEAIRVSSSTTDHDIKIDDELIAMLKSSKAVIADFTGNRTAVYYEAGFAMGLGIPVIWTCREDEADKLSFDTRQYPHIIWKDKDDLYKQVFNRLKAKIL